MNLKEFRNEVHYIVSYWGRFRGSYGYNGIDYFDFKEIIVTKNIK